METLCTVIGCWFVLGQEYMTLARSWFQFVRLLVSGRLATTTYIFLVYELPPSSYISCSLECARVCWLFELELIQSYSPILKLELVPFVLLVLSLRSMLRECTWHTLAGSLDTPHRLMPKASSCSRVTAHHFQFSTSCPRHCTLPWWAAWSFACSAFYMLAWQCLLLRQPRLLLCQELAWFRVFLLAHDTPKLRFHRWCCEWSN